MSWIIKGLVLVMLTWGAQAITEQEVRHLLETEYRDSNRSPKILAHKLKESFKLKFSADISIQSAEKLITYSLAKHPLLSKEIETVLFEINKTSEVRAPKPLLPKGPARDDRGIKAALEEIARRKNIQEQPLTQRPPSPKGARGRSPSPDRRAREAEARRVAEEERTLQEVLERSRREAEEARASKAASQRPASPSGARGRRSPSPVRKNTKRWMEETFLIANSRGAVAGFADIKNRLDIFNPLYSNHFSNLPDPDKRVFPNVPIIHPYDGIASPFGSFFPLVIKIDPLFLDRLPELVRERFNLKAHPNYEFYWVVQDSSSLAAESIVFRPQYWFQPNGQSTSFSLDVHLLSPDNTSHHLGSVGYSIHDGVASPNAPAIPFQDQLRSGGSHRFWSFIPGAKSALTCHWILGPGDIDVLKREIEKSATMFEFIENLSRDKNFFSNPAMIKEIEEVFAFKPR